MVKKGKIHEDYDGNTLEFIELSSETNGQHTKLKVCLQPNQEALACHSHDKSDEIYEILEGELTYEVNHKKMTVKAGETLILPRAQAHRHYNDSKFPVVMFHTISPSSDVEPLLASMLEQWKNGKVKNKAMNFWQSMIWVKYGEGRIFFEGFFEQSQYYLSQIFAPFASIIGHKKSVLH